MQERISITRSKWSERKSRIEDGIFFGTDEFIALEGSPRTGYTAAPSLGIASLLQSKPDYWCDLDELTGCDVQHGDIKIFGGSTSWEGEGFIAVEQSTHLLWVLHLSTSEEFVEIKTDGISISARSGGYPTCYEWHIPIIPPELFSVTLIS